MRTTSLWAENFVNKKKLRARPSIGSPAELESQSLTLLRGLQGASHPLRKRFIPPLTIKKDSTP